MPEITAIVQHEAGLHARPLAQFVKTARKFDASIRVTNLTRNRGPAEGTSPLNLMLLAVSQGHEIRIEADGPEAEEALVALRTLINQDFEG